MSGVKVQVLLRIKVDLYSGEKWDHDLAYSVFRDCMVFEDQITYQEDNDGWALSLFGEDLYIDYYLVDEEHEVDFNFDLTEDILQEKDFKDKFGQVEHLLDTKDVKFKFLTYSTGGCAGASEVE